MMHHTLSNYFLLHFYCIAVFHCFCVFLNIKFVEQLRNFFHTHKAYNKKVLDEFYKRNIKNKEPPFNPQNKKNTKQWTSTANLVI